MIRVWRLCRASLLDQAFTGEGARLYGGRWNSKGTAVVYTSATLSLAVLETLVHTEASNLPDDYTALSAEILDAVSITTVGMSELPADWREPRDHEVLQSIGKAWVNVGETALLSVPSAIVPDERNYLINPAHRDMSKIRIGHAHPFAFDSRLVGLWDRRW